MDRHLMQGGTADTLYPCVCVCPHLLKASVRMGWAVACWFTMPTLTSGWKGLFSEMCT